MEFQHEGRCNCESDNSRLPSPQFPKLDQLSFNPRSQDPSTPSPALIPATSTGQDELTREVFNQDLIMVSYFSGTRHLSHGLLDWMKLYVRLQSWNLGDEDALTADDLAIVENPGLIPILPTLRKKPRSERDELASQPGSMNQALQRDNYKRPETSALPLLFSDCNNPSAKLQCEPKTAATIATADLAATTTIASYPALIPTSNSLVPLKQMAMCLIMSQANAENSAQKAAGTEPESETAFTAEHKPEPATKLVSSPACSQNLEDAPFNEQWKLTQENIDEDEEMSIYRLRVIKPITAALDPITKTQPKAVKPVSIPESVHAKEINSITVSESNQKLESALINGNSNLSKKEDTLSITEGLYKLHAQKSATSEPVPSAKTIPESITTTECAPVVHHSAKKPKLTSIDTEWKPSKKEMNEVAEISMPEFINRLHAYKPVTANPTTRAKTKPEPSSECTSVSESPLKIETASIDTIYKQLKKKVKKAIKRDTATKQPHSDSARRHNVICSSMEDKIKESEFLYRFIAHMSATKAETKPEPTTKCAYVSENTLHLDPTSIDTIQTYRNEEEINITDEISASEFIYRLSTQTSATEKPTTKTKTTPEFTTEDALVPESALKIEPAPIDTEGKLLTEEMNKVINMQNGETQPSSARRRKKDKITESQFIYRVIAHMSATKAETKPEPTIECAYVSENTLQLDPTPIDTKQDHWNEEEINKTEKISKSEFINKLSAQTSATEKHATKTKSTPEFTIESAPVSENALKIEPSPMDTEEKLSKEEMNKVINTQNNEAPPSAAKQRPSVSARRRKKDKITESEFIHRLIAHMSATKAETKPEATTECAYVSENTLQLDPTPIDTTQEHWNEEEINKSEKKSKSEFINKLSAQTSATENHTTKPKLTPEFTIEGAPIETEDKLSKEEVNKGINTQNNEAPPSVAKQRPSVSARRRKKDKVTESEFIHRLIAHMAATKAETKPESTTECVYVSENTLQLDPTPIDTTQEHWNEEEINKTEKKSKSEFINKLSAQTSATEKSATKTKSTPEFTIEGAPDSENTLKIEPSPMDTEEKLSKEDVNKVINTQNNEAPPSAAKQRPSVSARRRKKDKLTESEFIHRLIAHMSATKAETKPEATIECAYVSENTLQLDPTPIDTTQEHWNEEEINKTEKKSKSEFINKLSAQTSATEKHATKTKSTPESTIEGAPMDTEENLLTEEMNKGINTQNNEAPPSVAKQRPSLSTRRRKKDEITKSEFIYKLIAHMSATKPETTSEPTNKSADVSENTLLLNPTPIDPRQKHWNEEEINKTDKLSTSQFIYRVNAQTSATENFTTKTKTKPEFTTEAGRVFESTMKIDPAAIDTRGSTLSKEEMNKVINKQNGAEPPCSVKRRPHVSARRRKKDKTTESESIYKLNTDITSKTKAETKPEPTAENNAVLQNVQQLPAAQPYENTKLQKKEAINETVVMSTSGSCSRIYANMPAATETKLESEIVRAPVLESMQNGEPSSVKRKRSRKRKRCKKDMSTPEIRAAPASPSPACETYTTHFEKVRLTYYDFFNFLEHEFDKMTQSDQD